MLFQFIGLIFSLYSSIKVVQTRRNLQAKNPTKRIGLLPSIVHTVYDAFEGIQDELDNVGLIIEERKAIQYSKQYNLPDPMLISLPDNRFQRIEAPKIEK